VGKEIAQRVPCLLERVFEPQQLPPKIRLLCEGMNLEDEKLGRASLRDFSQPESECGLLFEHRHQALRVQRKLVADRARSAGECRRRRSKETPASKTDRFEMFEPRKRQRAEALDAWLGSRRGDKQRRRVLRCRGPDHCKLQRLFGLEMGRYARLREPDFCGDSTEGERLQALGSTEVSGGGEDLPPAAVAMRFGRHGS